MINDHRAKREGEAVEWCEERADNVSVQWLLITRFQWPSCTKQSAWLFTPNRRFIFIILDSRSPIWRAITVGSKWSTAIAQRESGRRERVMTVDHSTPMDIALQTACLTCNNHWIPVISGHRAWWLLITQLQQPLHARLFTRSKPSEFYNFVGVLKLQAYAWRTKNWWIVLEKKESVQRKMIYIYNWQN